jgi:uncharacterized damage-inducible protein DinB
MPGQVPPLADERALLLAYVAQQRDALRIAAFGLTDDQARAVPGPGTLSVGGLIKHVAATERGWIDLVAGRPSTGSQEGYVDGFRMGPDETLADVLARLDETAADTEAVIGAVDDLGRDVPVPKGVPWYPDDVDAWSVRWVLLHLVEEIARHAGHADVVREAIDGATFHPLMAAAEGWPASPWLQPWEPPR